MIRPVTKRQRIPIPKTREQAVNLLGEIGGLQQRLTLLEASLNTQIEKLKQDAEDTASKLAKELSLKVDALHAYSTAHRAELTPGKAKTAVFPTGTISWRITPASVSISDAEKVLKRIKDLGLTQFIRTVEEINKQAMLDHKAQAESIEGVSIIQREDFVVKPARTESAIVKKITLKRPVPERLST